MKVYEGFWFQDKRCGFGTSFDDNEHIVFQGLWLDDMPHNMEFQNKISIETSQEIWGANLELKLIKLVDRYGVSQMKHICNIINQKKN